MSASATTPAPRPVPRRDWRDDAACLTADPELFFPLPGADDSAARGYCAACPVRVECLQDALAKGDGGIRGGLSEEARSQLRRDARTAASSATPDSPAASLAARLAKASISTAAARRESTREATAASVADAAASARLVVVDQLDEQVHAAVAAHPQVAELVDTATVRALVEGPAPEWCSRWEVALAAVVLLERGLTATATARALGEQYSQVKRWRDRAETGEALVIGERGAGQARRPARLTGPQPTTVARPGAGRDARGAA